MSTWDQEKKQLIDLGPKSDETLVLQWYTDTPNDQQRGEWHMMFYVLMMFFAHNMQHLLFQLPLYSQFSLELGFTPWVSGTRTHFFSHLSPKSWDLNACIGTYKNYRKTKSYTPFHLWGYDYTNLNMKPAKIGIFLPLKCGCFENPHHWKNDKQHIELSQLQLCFVSTIALGFQCCKLLQSPPKLSRAQSRRNWWLLWGCIQKMRIWYFW